MKYLFQHECNSPLNTPGQVDGISEYSKKYSATWRVLGSTDSWNKLSERERERGKNSFEMSPWKLLSVGNLSIIIKNF